MTTNNSSFTAISSGTRDSSADKGAIYYLDGNATDGRLNIAQNAAWNLGHNTTVVQNGNAGHTYMLGTIQGENFKYIANPGVGQRVDFGSDSCGYNVEDMTFIFLGSGNIFNHLEDNLNKTNLTGNINFIVDMAAGTAYLQFSSKEYANITLDVKPSNNSTVNLYVARSSEGFTSLTNLKTIGLSDLELLSGITSTSHGRIYDPEYAGVANNLLPLKTDSANAGNRCKEYFSIDVSDISDTETRGYAVDSDNNVLFNNYLSSEDVIPKANDGVTPLSFYMGRRVIMCKVREISNILSTTRKTISYKIRKAGFLEVKQDSFQLNAPIKIEELTVDTNYSSTGTVLNISTANELFDNYLRAIVDNMDVDFDVLSSNGDVIVIKQGWTLAQSIGQSELINFNLSNKTLTFKMNPGGLLATDKFKKFDGVVDSSLNLNTDMLYRRADGNIQINFENMNPNSFNITSAYVLYREVGETTWISVENGSNQNFSMNIIVSPNTEYEVSLRVPGYEWRTFTINGGDYGLTQDASLAVVTFVDGTPIFGQPFDSSIVDSFNFDLTTRRIIQTNDTGALMTIPFKEAYIGTQIALHNSVNVINIDNPMLPNETRSGFIIPDANRDVVNRVNPITFQLNAASNENVKLDFTLKYLDNNDADNRFIPTSNHYIYFSTDTYQLTLPIPSSEDNATACKVAIQPDLDKISSIETKTGDIESKTNNINNRVNNLPMS